MPASTTPPPSTWIRDTLREGTVIPAHPLALTGERKLDERRQRALTRYYHAANAGGIAVGVHTTQFAIRDPKHGLFQPVLELAAETVRQLDESTGRKTIRIAGICGETAQAIAEAGVARDLGYHAGLLSLAALRNAPDDALLEHCRRIAEVFPIIGFYLQPSVGGRVLPYSFWRGFAEIPNVIAIKLAPFNRYQTIDVMRAVAEAGRQNEIALYTGNDDNIVLDLLTEYRFIVNGSGGCDSVPVESAVNLRMTGGLLGHWACWTKKAVELLEECKRARASAAVPAALLTRAIEVTDCNAAFFDAANQFRGCIAGIHEVLRRQGLLENILCLDPEETLSIGQAEEIDRIHRSYPHLNDDGFVAEHLDQWLG